MKKYDMSVIQYSIFVLKTCSHFLFFFNDTATTEIYTLSLHDALPISGEKSTRRQGTQSSINPRLSRTRTASAKIGRATSELQSQFHLVCRLLLEKKKKNTENPNRLSIKLLHSTRKMA